MKFRCDCRGGFLEIIYDKSTKNFPYPSISVLIYSIYSPKTGRKYKKPKLLADIVLMNNAFPEEINKFLDFVKGIPTPILDKDFIRCSYCNRIQPKDMITKNGCLSCDVNYRRELCKIKEI